MQCHPAGVLILHRTIFRVGPDRSKAARKLFPRSAALFDQRQTQRSFKWFLYVDDLLQSLPRRNGLSLGAILPSDSFRCCGCANRYVISSDWLLRMIISRLRGGETGTEMSAQSNGVRLSSKPAWAEVWHLWRVIIPRRSISGKLVWGQVWRRWDGRRWSYKKVVGYVEGEPSIGNATEAP